MVCSCSQRLVVYAKVLKRWTDGGGARVGGWRRLGEKALELGYFGIFGEEIGCFLKKLAYFIHTIYVYIYTYICMFVYKYIYKHIYNYTNTHKHIYIYEYLYIHHYIYTHIYNYTH